MAEAPDPKLQQKSDADLLSEVGMEEDFPDEAQAAFREFYRRHMGHLYTRLMKWIDASETRSRLLDGEQLASSTMETAFRKAASYRDKSEGDPKRASNQVRAWLFKIATNLALSAQRSPSMQMQFKELPDSDIIEEVEAAPPMEVSRETAARVALALEKLNEVDRDILYTCLSYGAFGEQADALPADVRKELLAKHGLAEATLRQRKSRALTRLRELLS